MPWSAFPILGIALATIIMAQTAQPDDDGIPVTNPLVLAKCGGTCHIRDARSNLQRISSSRATPEGWQNVLLRMMADYGVSVTPLEARAIVKDLSNNHGLTPSEAMQIRYNPERRIHTETNIPNDQIRDACAKCHAFALPLSWRRSPSEWKQFLDSHAARKHFPANPEAIAYLSTNASLHSPEWDGRRTRDVPNLSGRWLVTAALTGNGKYYGEMQVEQTASGDFSTTVNLTSLTDASVLVRSGRSVVYGGTAWRGRSVGTRATAADAPDVPSNEAREVMSMAATHDSADGRWFWGHYQEFGFDVHMQRPSTAPTLLALDRFSVKTGARSVRIRLVGDSFPASGLAPADVDFGLGVNVRAILSSTPREIAVEVDVAADAPLGKHSASVRGSILKDALSVYDRVDYLKVVPESSVASFSDSNHPKGYLQYEAIGYQRGPDGKLHTGDDLELGPIDVTWSLQVFHAPEGNGARHVGSVNSSGLFVPASENPRNNFDVWISATAKHEKNQKGQPLVGKSYLVVAPPTYTFNGRRYVRDLDHWIDDGPAIEDKR